MQPNLHQVDLLLGSNLSPIENLQKAVEALRSVCRLKAVSTTWENPSLGSEGPNFYNTALRIETSASSFDLKWQILYPIEIKLGRIRTLDKNAPRTIDLDIIIYDEIIVDEAIWTKLYVTLPMSDLRPDLTDPTSHKTLKEIAIYLIEQSWAKAHPEIQFSLSS